MEKVIKIVSLHDKQSDYQYWLSRPIQERLETIEILRQQYIRFRKDVEPRLQRICRIVKQK